MALLPAAVAVMFSPMMFDAPGSTKNHEMVALFVSVVSFPVLCVLSIAGSWIAWTVWRTSPATIATVVMILVACLPIASLALFGALMMRS